MKKLLIALALFGAVTAFAEEGSDKEGDKKGGPCMADAEKLCKGVEPGEGRIMKCLMDQDDKLSAECKAQREKVKSKAKGKMKGFKEACKADSEKHCAGMKLGDGKLGPCMKKNFDKLSEECRDALREMRPKKKKNKR